MRTTLRRLLRAVLATMGALALVTAATSVAGAQADPADGGAENRPADAGDDNRSEGEAPDQQAQDGPPADEADDTEETEGTKQISAQALEDHECDETEWHFVITQVRDEASAPDEISVEFSDGTEDVELGMFTGGVAHYTVTGHLDATVSSATAEIYADWSGQFNLSHGPCDNQPQEGEGPEEGPEEGPDEEVPEEEQPEEEQPEEEVPEEEQPEQDEGPTEEQGDVGDDQEVTPEEDQDVAVDEGDEQVLADQGEDVEVAGDQVVPAPDVDQRAVEQAVPSDRETAVLGARTERAALPRTGPLATTGLAVLGALLLLAGFGLERVGTRLRARA